MSKDNPPVPDGMSTAALATMLKVTTKTVHKWVKSGCPCRREKSAHGKPAMFFDLREVRTWLVASGNTTRSMLAVPEAIAVPADVPQVDTMPAMDTGAPLPVGSQFEAALDRARQTDQATFALWAKTLASDPIAAAAHHARWIAAADCLLRLEKAKDEILIGENTTIRTADAYDATATMLQAVRIDLEAMPNAIAPRLSGSVSEMAALLREAVQDVLRHTYKGEK